MASPPNALRKSPVVSVVIPKDLLATLDDYRWDNRMSRSQAIVKAVRKYLDQPEAPADAWRRRGLR
jgi:metal-responsive CopG/Arc/MetJ family transcriptional regulator